MKRKKKPEILEEGWIVLDGNGNVCKMTIPDNGIHIRVAKEEEELNQQDIDEGWECIEVLLVRKDSIK